MKGTARVRVTTAAGTLEDRQGGRRARRGSAEGDEARTWILSVTGSQRTRRQDRFCFAQ